MKGRLAGCLGNWLIGWLTMNGAVHVDGFVPHTGQTLTDTISKKTVLAMDQLWHLHVIWWLTSWLCALINVDFLQQKSPPKQNYSRNNHVGNYGFPQFRAPSSFVLKKALNRELNSALAILLVSLEGSYSSLLVNSVIYLVNQCIWGYKSRSH